MGSTQVGPHATYFLQKVGLREALNLLRYKIFASETVKFQLFDPDLSGEFLKFSEASNRFC